MCGGGYGLRVSTGAERGKGRSGGEGEVGILNSPSVLINRPLPPSLPLPHSPAVFWQRHPAPLQSGASGQTAAPGPSRCRERSRAPSLLG